MIPSPARKRSPLHPFRHTYPSSMPLHRERETTMIKNSKIAWLSGILGLITLLAIVFTLGQAQTSAPSTSHTAALSAAQEIREVDAYTLPFCEEEDGSTQDLCLWDDASGDQLVNLDYGHFTYNLTTGEMITYEPR